jgi:hypothetical protein
LPCPTECILHVTSSNQNRMPEQPQDNQNYKEKFLYPIGKYYGEFTPGKLAFNANLQLFAQKVAYLCDLEANDKISPEDTYQEIKKLWKQLQRSKEELLENDPFSKQDKREDLSDD